MSRNTFSKTVSNSGGNGIAPTRNGLIPLEPVGVVTPNEKRLNVADEKDVVRGKTGGERGTTMTITEAEGGISQSRARPDYQFKKSESADVAQQVCAVRLQPWTC